MKRKSDEIIRVTVFMFFFLIVYNYMEFILSVSWFFNVFDLDKTGMKRFIIESLYFYISF